MTETAFRLGVLARRRPPANRWSRGSLTPSAVLSPAPPLPPRSRVSAEGGVEVWYLDAAELLLHPGDAGHYRDNLASGRPALWVALDGAVPETARIRAVTADPYEGEGLAGDVALVVEAVEMPAALLAPIGAFVAAHFVEIPFKKRKRRPADPNALSARAPRILQPDQKWGPRR